MQLLRLPEVLKMVPVSKTTWYAMIKRKEAPAPINLGPRSVAWDSDDIEAWIKERKALSIQNQL
jgi:prophage regulatory protein